MKLTKEQVMGIIRHTLTFGGGVLITLGLADTTLVTEISGAVLTFSGALWSIIAKNK